MRFSVGDRTATRLPHIKNKNIFDGETGTKKKWLRTTLLHLIYLRPTSPCAQICRSASEMQKAWEDEGIYEQMLKRNADKPSFILHDGPPFSNGNIHMGTAMNKVLKDFINKYKSMHGFRACYRPGWDNHGMPIESAIIKQSKLDRKKMTVPEFRDACHEFAQNFVNIQMDQFKRLGVLGEWDDPYLTMKPGVRGERDPRVRRDVQEGLYLQGTQARILVPARRDRACRG